MKFNPSVLKNGVLAYVRKDGDDKGIHYSNGTRGPAGDIRSAAWSPDGSRVVFHKRVTFQRQPWVKTWSGTPGYEFTLTGGGPRSVRQAIGTHSSAPAPTRKAPD